MNITFDTNVWTLLALALTAYSIIATRSRASTDDLRRENQRLRDEINQAAATSHKEVEVVRNEFAAYKEKLGGKLNDYGERLRSAETNIDNSITDDDIVAVHKRIDQLQADMHSGISEISKSNARIGESVARIEGIMTGWTSKHPRENSS